MVPQRRESGRPSPAGGFVGTGPLAVRSCHVRAAGLLGRADLVFATAEVAERVRHLIPAGAQVRDRSELDADPRLLVKAVKAGQLVVAAYDGDPLLFGSAAGGAAACAKARVRSRSCPHARRHRGARLRGHPLTS